MKLIKPKVEIISQESGLFGIYKQIELAGRTCYKSEDKITIDSCKEFVQRMINSGHTAMLEHGTVYLAIPITTGHSGGSEINYMNNKYSVVTESKGLSMKDEYNDPCDCWCVTTNFRVLVENGWIDDLKYYLCEPTQWHVKRVCVRFTCDRGIMAELTRHRAFSFAVESTRYCNYSKDKFGNELTFVLPYWSNIAEGHMPFLTLEDVSGFSETYALNFSDKAFIKSLYNIEKDYMYLLNENNPSKLIPQQARQILPNALKTEVVMTGFISDWKHFFRLRTTFLAETGKPHPDMSYLADILYTEFVKRKFIEPLV